MKYDVTVSIVNYNDYKRTRQAILSLLEQTRGVRFKIYVIDNASGDDSAERLASEFPMVSFIFSDKNLGYGGANNLVLPRIESLYHVIMNPDVLLCDDVLKILFDYMQAHLDVGMCGPAVYFLNGAPQPLPKRNPKLSYLLANRIPGSRLERLRREYKMLDHDLTKPTEVEFISGCFMFVRTALLREAGGFDDRYFLYFEDADLTREIAKRSKVMYVPAASILHGYRKSSAKRLKYLAIHVSSMLKYFFKWRKVP